MDSLTRIIDFLKPLAGLIIIGVLAYFFSEVFIWFLIAAVLSLIGRPIVNKLTAIKFGKHNMPQALASVLTILVFFLVIAAFFLILVPLVARQAAVFYDIDTNEVMEYFKDPINNVKSWLVSYNIIENNFDFYATITNELSGFLNMASISSAFTSALSAISAISLGAFAVIFLLFFMLNEPQMLRNILIALIPEKYEQQTLKALHEIHGLLSRYFIGLIIEVVCMMTLVTVFLTILGVRNALLIGFLAGLLNVIPYLGPVIGGAVGCVLGLITTLGAHQYDLILPCLLKIAGSVAVANIIDNFVLQPLIYSKSVKAHPVEIFVVIILAGKMGGVFGMLVAIPTYTIIRVIAREFFGQLKFVNALTREKTTATNDDSQRLKPFPLEENHIEDSNGDGRIGKVEDGSEKDEPVVGSEEEVG